MIRVQPYQDRVSVSFCDDQNDVPWIITVTFDNSVVAGLDNTRITEMAIERMREFAARPLLRT